MITASSKADQRLAERASLHKATAFAEGARRREQSAISVRRATRRGVLSSKRLRRSTAARERLGAAGGSANTGEAGAVAAAPAIGFPAAPPGAMAPFSQGTDVRQALRNALVVLSAQSSAAKQTAALRQIRLLLSDPDTLEPPLGLLSNLESCLCSFVAWRRRMRSSALRPVVALKHCDGCA